MAASSKMGESMSVRGGSVAQSFDTTASGTNSMAQPPLTNHGIWVAVRVRPFNKRELADSASNSAGKEVSPVCELERDRKTMTLLDPQKNYQERANFQFDYCFSAFNTAIELAGDRGGGDGDDSDDEEAMAEKAQKSVYEAIGQPIVNAAWAGYNGCVFAYGQTSSGKTYTMMGTKRDPGLIPRLCRELFEKIEDDESTRRRNEELGQSGANLDKEQKTTLKKVTKCQVSYMEIYNEKVKDLLKTAPKGERPKFTSRFDNSSNHDIEFQALRVRQHPLHGPFVEGLTKIEVNNWLDCVRIIRQGNEVRSTHATALNEASSRSHAIFQIVVTQTEALGAKVRGKEVTNHRVSKINLVDLAGSERISQSNVTGKHATEANSINLSLTTLRKVIGVLVDQAKKKSSGKPVVVPYRESMLTWVLSDNFGGNSKTAMIANVSPHSSCFLETESTLRYATLAKGIVNRIRVNEDPSAKLIRELQSQLKAMQAEMSHGPQQERVKELEDQMEENKRAMEELLAREEGMRKLIQESRVREGQLKKEADNWKAEAEKLEKEKEELRRQLSEMKTSGSPNAKPPQGGADKKEVDFWNTDDLGNDMASTEDVSCPPPKRQPSARRRKSGAGAGESSTMDRQESSVGREGSMPAFLKSENSVTATSTTTTTTGGGGSEVKTSVIDPPKMSPAGTKEAFADRSSSQSSLQQDLPVLDRRPDSSTTGSLALNSTSRSQVDNSENSPVDPNRVSPSVRHGRRAATEEGKEREPIVKNPPQQIRTAEVGKRGASSKPVDDQAIQSQSMSAVPMSLQHLVGPGGNAPAKSSSTPDALDAFLSGSTANATASVANKKERAVPPWRQKRGGGGGGY